VTRAELLLFVLCALTIPTTLCFGTANRRALDAGSSFTAPALSSQGVSAKPQGAPAQASSTAAVAPQSSLSSYSKRPHPHAPHSSWSSASAQSTVSSSSSSSASKAGPVSKPHSSSSSGSSGSSGSSSLSHPRVGSAPFDSRGSQSSSRQSQSESHESSINRVISQGPDPSRNLPDSGEDYRPKKKQEETNDNSLDHLLGSGTEPCKKFKKGCSFKLVVAPKMDKELLDLLPNLKAEHNALVEPRLDSDDGGPQARDDQEELDEFSDHL
jgi:hypothetical protein